MFDGITAQVIAQWGGFGVIAVLFSVLLRYVLKSHEAQILDHMETNRRAWTGVETLTQEHTKSCAAIVAQLELINQRLANNRTHT